MNMCIELNSYAMGLGLYVWQVGGDREGTMTDGVLVTREPTGVMAAYIPDEVDKARVQMLFAHALEENALLQYFHSTWFPFAHVPVGQDVMAALASKINTLDPKRLDDYVMVIKSHWRSIEDNFNWPLPVEFDKAVEQEKRLNKVDPEQTARNKGGDFDGDRLPTPSIFDDTGPFLKVPIPEGATHYQDVSCSDDGGLRFFKRVEGHDATYYVWGINTVGSGAPKWIEHPGRLLRNRPLIKINNN